MSIYQSGIHFQTFYEKIGGDEALSKLIKMHVKNILVFPEFRSNNLFLI
jgi:hypothetical protein